MKLHSKNEKIMKINLKYIQRHFFKNKLLHICVFLHTRTLHSLKSEFSK